jgi:hypothetical protein
MMALGTTFYGIFSSNNTPDFANFPNGVKYQRTANFATKTLLNTDDVTPVSASIDPFFFKVLTQFGTLVTAIASGGKFANLPGIVRGRDLDAEQRGRRAPDDHGDRLVGGRFSDAM